jgi:hypothetical protein
MQYIAVMCICVQMMKLGKVETLYIQDNLAGPSGSRATVPLYLTLSIHTKALIYLFYST